MSPLRALGLFAALALLGACAAPSAPAAPSSDARSPAGVYRELAERDGVTLVEGAQLAYGQLLPDGKLWLRGPSGSYRLLTPERLFEKPFFAAGGAFLPDGSVVVKVNFDEDGDNLYRVAADGSAARFLSDAERLGLASIDERSLRLSEDGQSLLFQAARTIYDNAAPDGFYEETAWYVLPLDAPERGLRPAAPR